MAFDNDAPSGGNAAPPTANPTAAADETTTNMPTGDLQPPANDAPAPQPPVQLQPAPAAPSRSFMGALAHALMGGTLAVAAKGVQAIAGPAPVDSYSTDETGKMTPVFRPDNTKSRLERIALHALEGLAAGSQVPQQKSRAAAFAAGLGAGASNEINQAKERGLLKRQQAKEQFEQEQKAMTDKAIRAAHNASTYSLWQKSIDESNNHDPERGKNLDIQNAVLDYIARNPDTDMKAEVVSDREVMAMRQQDPHTIADHSFFPLGMREMKSNGEPVFEADGVTPKTEGQVLMISGKLDNGKVPLPQSFVDDLQKYGRIAGINATLPADHELPLGQFLAVDKRLNEAKAKVQDGWKEKQVGENAVTVNGKKVQQNTVSGETRDYAGVPNIEDKPAAQAVETNLKKGQTAEAWAKAREADAKRLTEDGRHIDAFGNVSPLNEKEFNKRYDAFNKSKQYTNLQTLQGSYGQFQQTVNDINSGKPFTGAASVVGLFNAIGISAAPLAGKGFRITENTIREHVDARGVDQAAYQKLLSLKNGDVITPQQLKDYATIAAGVYRDSYINAANEEFRQIGIVDVLPRGNNTVMDSMTMQLYLKIAGNNPDVATQAATRNGWVIPPSKGNK